MLYDANGAARLTQAVLVLMVMAVVGLVLSGLMACWQERRYAPVMSTAQVRP